MSDDFGRWIECETDQTFEEWTENRHRQKDIEGRYLYPPLDEVRGRLFAPPPCTQGLSSPRSLPNFPK